MVSMTLELLAAPFQLGMVEDGDHNFSDNLPSQFGSCWYFTRKEIENSSPSRTDGINSNKESELRERYCSFIKDFGIRLGVPQVTIATATVFCHRFYLHQSHAKNDWQTVATVCMFLASKVEDTPLSLDKIVIAAYEMIYKKEPATARRIHQKDVFEKQKALILIGERLLLATIRFDFNIQHPYRALLLALKKFHVTQKDMKQVAWNFVNDSFHTTLCLQYKPHYIAAASLFLAAKLSNVKLPSGNGYVWWHEFDVAPQQLHAAVQEMTNLLGYFRRPVVTPALEKLTAVIPITSSVVKEEPSCSPDSCVLSRPGSSSSSSSQSSQVEAGGQKPIGIIVPSSTNNLNSDGQQHASMPCRREPQCQNNDSESLNTINENHQVIFDKANRAMTKHEQDSGVEAGLTSEDAEKAPPPPPPTEQVAMMEDSQGIDEDVGQARPDPEEFVDTGDCQIPCGDMVQARRGPEQAADAEDCQASSKVVNQSRAELAQYVNSEVSRQFGYGEDQAAQKSGEVVNNDVSEAHGENLNILEARYGEVANNKFSWECCEGVHQASVKTEQAEGELYKMDEGKIEALTVRTLEVETVGRAVISQGYEDGDLAMPKPEDGVSIEFSHGSGECVDQARVKPPKPEDGICNAFSQESSNCVDLARVKPEQVGGGFGKIDKDRIKALMMRRKQERQYKKKAEDMDDLSSEIVMHSGYWMEQARANTETVANCAIDEGSGIGENKVSMNHVQIEDGICKIDMDRIKALRNRRKQEREANKRTEVIMDDSNGDFWIERELETGIELGAEYSRKKQRLV